METETAAGDRTESRLDPGPLLEPRSIAVVGATDRAESYAGAVLRNLARSGFAGPVWGVNPNRTEALGFECLPTLLELPEPADAVVVAIPATGVPKALAEAAARGCGGAIVLAAGFGEVAAGRALEAELRHVAHEAGMPVCGPNGNGIVSVASRAPMWGDEVRPLEPGPVALVTQSGNVGVNAISSRRGIAWHTLVSTGNQAVLDASDWLTALARLEGVRSIALFLEDDGDGTRFAEALASCAERGIGIAVCKVGSSAAGAAAASAHTGALAKDQRIFRALIAEAGGAWASDPHELLELAKALAGRRARPSGGGGLAVLTCSGGDSGVAADQAKRLGLQLPPLSAATSGELTSLLPTTATIGNPLDYTASIWAETERLRRIVATVACDPGIDQLLLLYDQPPELSREAEAGWAAVRAGLVQGAIDGGGAPLFASTLPDLFDDAAGRELGAAGIPALAGLATALRCALALRAPPGEPGRLLQIAAAAAAADRDAASREELDEAEAKELLQAAGIAVPAGRIATDIDDAVRTAEVVGYPVALKLCAPGLLHKSGAGALATGLATPDAVRDAYRRLARLPVAARSRVLVERMSATGIELFVAATADGVVPALIVGLGGIWAEVLDDVVVIPLPANSDRVERALGSLRGAPALTGGRDGPTVDLASAARLASRAGELLLDRGLSLLELNPVIAGPQGAVAVDAVARRA